MVRKVFYNICLFSLKIALSVSFIVSCSFDSSVSTFNTNTKNIILIIGDGMGSEQIKAANFYQYGEEGHLSFEDFPFMTYQTTYSESSEITDSAASATAMATGVKVNNGTLSVYNNGHSNLKTILEIAQDEGKMTGLVTTAISIHATPAAFAAHTTDRYNYSEIGLQYMTESRPDVIFGGGNANLSISMAESMGYTAVTNATDLLNLNYAPDEKFFGYFGDDHLPYMYDGMGSLPELSDMAMKALDLLEESNSGFFLMIEGGRIDHAGHANDLVRNIYEVIELSDTVSQVMTWASGRNDTVIIVTADHETGGLFVQNNNGIGILPDVTWSTTGHTGVSVPVYIWGENANWLHKNINDNTDIFHGLVSEQ